MCLPPSPLKNRLNCSMKTTIVWPLLLLSSIARAIVLSFHPRPTGGHRGDARRHKPFPIGICIDSKALPNKNPWRVGMMWPLLPLAFWLWFISSSSPRSLKLSTLIDFELFFLREVSLNLNARAY